MDNLELTPVDVRHKEFSSSMFGYKKDEVREVLKLISNQMEDSKISETRLFKDKQPLSNSNEEQEEQESIEQAPVELPQEQKEPVIDVDKHQDLIGRTLILAEQTKTEIIDNAKAKAENIIKEAEFQAKKTIEEAKHYMNVLEHQYINLKEQKKQFLMQFKSELETYLARINQDSILKKENEASLDKEFSKIKEVKKTEIENDKED